MTIVAVTAYLTTYHQIGCHPDLFPHTEVDYFIGPRVPLLSSSTSSILRRTAAGLPWVFMSSCERAGLAHGFGGGGVGWIVPFGARCSHCNTVFH